MENFPIFLNLKKKSVLVIGGGDIALRKVKLLIKVKPEIKIIAKQFCEELECLAKSNSIKLIKKSFVEADVDNPMIIIAATNNIKLNKTLSLLAKKKNILINVVDQPSLCTFTMGSIIERDSLVIAISSAGKAPVLARKIREKIEILVPQGYSKLVDYAGDLRALIKEKIKLVSKRRFFWEQFFESEIIYNSLLKQEKIDNKLIKKLIKESNLKLGEVYLVGAGPGERDLLTLRALQLMQKCDLCIYDNLVSSEVLELVRRDADLIYAGKKLDQHTLSQQEINKLLIKYAKKGKKVLRLKGGDPFIFGRGGEEIECLMKEKINFQVVPGITAANGISAYAGIPLTHRDFAQSCLFLTGHFKEGKIDFNWPMLVSEKQTLVIYMGLLSLADLTFNLIKNGMKKDTPVAVIESGTTSKQKVIIGKLSHIRSKVSRANIKSPALIIVGEVVNLRQKLNWFK